VFGELANPSQLLLSPTVPRYCQWNFFKLIVISCWRECLGFWALFFFKYCFYLKCEFISSGSYFSSSFLSPSSGTMGLPAFLVWGPIDSVPGEF
jgi:hypothetical protein